jgi:hypothetical protein
MRSKDRWLQLITPCFRGILIKLPEEASLINGSIKVRP